ncbi:MAG: asparagine synthase (glutamine-hydrolyzing) [Oligoflexia bacterium]|nr:asparagine synthase (glutamine-hydrolyzing) [Oligoflexia bacterium]
MCGIVGLIRFDKKKIEYDEIKELNDLIYHRGPDDNGIFIENNVGLAMHRLSIIDLQNGVQPMFHSLGNLVIVYNGEIYNYKELKKELQDNGVIFKTNSDTEVILNGYQFWRESLFSKLNGIFVFVLFDRSNKKITIARDRLGEKQLYYYLDDQYLVFGSEMKVPMFYNKGKNKLNLNVLHEFLNYQYIGGSEAAVKGIRQFPEAHWMEISTESCQNTILKNYWNIYLLGNNKIFQGSEDDACEEIYRILTDSVRLRLTADVPISVMLSAGLDSSMLAYILSKELNTSCKYFTLGFTDKNFDESNDTSKLVSYLNLDWEKKIINADDIATNFPLILNHIDSLQANTAQLVYYMVTQEIKKNGFKVAFNGNGGDELFAGYPTYQADTIYEKYKVLPSVIKNLINSTVEKLPPSFGRVSLDYKLKKFTECPYFDYLKAHASWRTIFSNSELDDLFSKEMKSYLSSPISAYDRVIEQILNYNSSKLKNVLISDFKAWLTPMLPWVDNISMSQSVELRLPFLDHRLLELVFSLPDSFIFKGWKLKRIMKKISKDKLPAQIIHRPKTGTHLPIGKWLNHDLSMISDYYLSEKVLNKDHLFNMFYVNKLLSEHKQKKKDNSFKLWTLLIFSAWKEKFSIFA